MGITKTEGFTEGQVRTANLAKALGHPARIAILEQLLESQPCICGDLVDVLPLSQATVSQHLRELKNVGLIQGTIDGPRVNYRINERVWDEAKGVMTNLLDQEVKDAPDKVLADFY
ncbi:MAG: metalloregulator ArsR/SmtB family transcription factor [Bacteroidota bacterium]